MIQDIKNQPKHFFTHTLITLTGGAIAGLVILWIQIEASPYLDYPRVLPLVGPGMTALIYTIREILQKYGKAGNEREAQGLPRWDQPGFLGGLFGGIVGAILLILTITIIRYS